MYGELPQLLGLGIGLVAGGVIETRAKEVAKQELKDLSAIPYWKIDEIDSSEKIDGNLEEKRSAAYYKKARMIGKNALSEIGAFSAIVGFSLGVIVPSILQLSNNNSTVVQSGKVGLALDRSGSMVLSRVDNQLSINLENRLLKSIGNLSNHFNVDVTSQNSSSIETYTSAINTLPIGEANIYQSVNDLLPISKNIYVISNGNGFNDSSQVSSIISEAKKHNQTISFYDLSNTSSAASAQMKTIAKSTKGNYYSSKNPFSSFSNAIKKRLDKLSKNPDTRSGGTDILNYSLIAGLATAGLVRAYKKRSKTIIGS